MCLKTCGTNPLGLWLERQTPQELGQVRQSYKTSYAKNFQQVFSVGMGMEDGSGLKLVSRHEFHKKRTF